MNVRAAGLATRQHSLRTEDVREEFAAAGLHNDVAAELDEVIGSGPVANRLDATTVDGGATGRASGHDLLGTTCVDDVVKGGANDKFKAVSVDYIIVAKAPGPNHHHRTRGGGAVDGRASRGTKHELNATALDERFA